MEVGKLYRITYGDYTQVDNRNRYLGRHVVYLGEQMQCLDDRPGSPKVIGHKLLLNGEVIYVDSNFLDCLKEIP